jgi:phosphoheptose isomerase/rubrerythrin
VTESGKSAVEQHLEGLAEVARRVAAGASGQVVTIADMVSAALQRGNKLLFCGNGGSAADAQHLATEYVVRFRRSRRALAAIALTTDSSLLTAAANDLGFEQVFARQIEALARPGDVLFLHTTSGESPNLIAAADAARAAGVITIGMLARDGGRLRAHVQHALVVPTENGAHAQELHIALGHVICSLVEQRLGAKPAPGQRAAAAASAAPAAGPRAAAAASAAPSAGPRAPSPDAIGLLHEARLAEKRQALFYRALAAAAEDAGDNGLSERLNGLHADEQHHLSRLTVRLMELTEPVDDLSPELAPDVRLDGWEELARGREAEEIARYAGLLTHELDARTRALLEVFLEVERHHAAALGGKWMGAEP